MIEVGFNRAYPLNLNWTDPLHIISDYEEKEYNNNKNRMNKENKDKKKKTWKRMKLFN